jgi:hypothetical protein
MFDSIALFPGVLHGHTSTKPAPRGGFRALVKAFFEGLVTANSHRFEDPQSPEYRFPPF